MWWCVCMHQGMGVHPEDNFVGQVSPTFVWIPGKEPRSSSFFFTHWAVSPTKAGHKHSPLPSELRTPWKQDDFSLPWGRRETTKDKRPQTDGTWPSLWDVASCISRPQEESLSHTELSSQGVLTGEDSSSILFSAMCTPQLGQKWRSNPLKPWRPV